MLSGWTQNQAERRSYSSEQLKSVTKSRLLHSIAETEAEKGCPLHFGRRNRDGSAVDGESTTTLARSKHSEEYCKLLLDMSLKQLDPEEEA